jgi:hypothetical protein
MLQEEFNDSTVTAVFSFFVSVLMVIVFSIVQIREIWDALDKKLERKTIKYHLRSHKNCFYGQELLEVVMKATNWNKDTAITFITKLLADGILINISHSNKMKFKDGKVQSFFLILGSSAVFLFTFVRFSIRDICLCFRSEYIG